MANFFTRPKFEDRQIVQYTNDTISLSGTTAIANPGYLQINQGAAPGLVATSLDFDGTVIWGPVSGLSWSVSACTSPLYVNNIVACPSSAGTIVVQSGILTVNGALQLNPTLSGGTANDRLLVIDSNGYVKVGQTGTSISSLSYNNNNLVLTLNDGSIFTATINTMTGLTINGNLTVSGNTSIVGNLNVTGNTYVSGSVSATTFYGNGSNLTGIPDYYVTGGTFVSNILTLNRQNGSVIIAGFSGFTDNYVTGGTYNYGTGTLTLNRQNGSFSVSGLSFTGNTLGTCITDIYVQNLYGCGNPITIQSSLKSAAGGSTAAGTLSFAFGNGVAAAGNYSMAQGNATSTAGGTYAHAEGISTLASANSSHAEGNNTVASGNWSHAEGRLTLATNTGSHAEGSATFSSGLYSHSEGLGTSATTIGSHSQGIRTIASGDYSFASGSGSTSSGVASFVHSSNSTVSGDRSVVLGGNGINGTQSDYVYVPNLNIDSTPTNDDTNTKVLVRNTSTGNVETKTFGLDNIVLTVAPPAIPIAGVGPSVDTVKGIPQGQVITGYTSIYVNNVSQAGPTVTTNFGTYNNTTGLFTTNVDATLMISAWIHLKPDTSTSTAWSFSGTGEFGIGICPNNATDIYVGDYQTIIPDPNTAQYVYELYGANAPRTNQIDISTGIVLYVSSGSTFRIKVLNKTDRNYAGSGVVSGDGVRFSITRIM